MAASRMEEDPCTDHWKVAADASWYCVAVCDMAEGIGHTVVARALFASTSSATINIGSLYILCVVREMEYHRT
jgi:hypothetical protein